MPRNWNPCALLLEMRIEITLWEPIWFFFIALNIKLSYDQEILLKEWKEGTQTETYIPEFKESLFITAKGGNSTVCDHIVE